LTTIVSGEQQVCWWVFGKWSCATAEQ